MSPVYADFPLSQCLADLCTLARTFGASAGAVRHAPRPDGSESGRLDTVISGGGRFDSEDWEKLGEALLLAANFPQEDTAAFVVATAVLLADRLQDGAGTDNLFWHYDVHRSAYRAQPARVRAILMRGFAECQSRGRSDLAAPPVAGDLVSHPRANVEGDLDAALSRQQPAVDALASTLPGAGTLRLKAGPDAIPADLPAALTGQMSDTLSDDLLAALAGLCFRAAMAQPNALPAAARLWAREGNRIIGLQESDRAPLLNAARWLYETSGDWTPPMDPPAPMIPFPDDVA